MKHILVLGNIDFTLESLQIIINICLSYIYNIVLHDIYIYFKKMRERNEIQREREERESENERQREGNEKEREGEKSLRYRENR